MEDELAAQCCEQGVHVLEFMAERVSPGESRSKLRGGVSMNCNQRSSDCCLESELLAIPLRSLGTALKCPKTSEKMADCLLIGRTSSGDPAGLQPVTDSS